MNRRQAFLVVLFALPWAALVLADGAISVTDARTRIVHVTSSLQRLPDGGFSWTCSGVCRFGQVLSTEISAGPASYASCKAQLDTACTGAHLAAVASDAGVDGQQQ